jgi:hypothetical protein
VKSDIVQKLKGREISSEGYKRVVRLPRVPESGMSYWIDSPNGHYEYTHRFFRFPAKFHPPVVRWALGNYGRKGSMVLDPFTGSGTVQVEALTRGIFSVGIDIDPLACLIARAKTIPINPRGLQIAFFEIQSILTPFIQRRSGQNIAPGADISESQYETESLEASIPPIPNIFHWFRRYVVIDLARILWAIEQVGLAGREDQFFKACLAAIIRRVSNADPDPVSGLEVTCVQAKKNITRTIKVYDSFFSKVKQAITGMGQLWTTCRESGIRTTARIIQGDVLNTKTLNKIQAIEEGYPLVITSPPYCRAVEYSRRHKLEMYWLGLIKSQAEHINLAHAYIGRKLVRLSDWDDKSEFGVKALDNAVAEMASIDIHKARTVKSYFYSMDKVFANIASIMKKNGTLVCVIGDSVCCKVSIPTADFIIELASDHFTLNRRFLYALHNHSMQYGLWNGDGIKQEHVLIMKPR